MDPSAAFAELIRAWGPLGAVVTIAAIVVGMLYRRIQELNDARLNDLKEQLKQVSELTRDVGKTTEHQTQAVNSLRDVVLATAPRKSDDEG